MSYLKHMAYFYCIVLCGLLSSCIITRNRPQIQYKLFNSDDCLLDDTYESLVKKMEEHDSMIVSSYCTYFYDNLHKLDSCVILNFFNEGLQYARNGDSVHLFFIVIDKNKPCHIAYDGENLNESFTMEKACSVFHVSNSCFYKIFDNYGMCGLDDNGFGLTLKGNERDESRLFTFYFGSDKMLKAIEFPIQTK